MPSRFPSANNVFTWTPCAAQFSGETVLFRAHRSEQPSDLISGELCYWVVFDDGDEAINLPTSWIFPVASSGMTVPYCSIRTEISYLRIMDFLGTTHLD